MPMREHLNIRVELVIHVDGHRLTFEHTSSTSGARYHGEPPPEHYTDSVLEAGVRAATTWSVGRVTAAAENAVDQLYPIAPGVTGPVRDR
jgi:hypothetical protein